MKNLKFLSEKYFSDALKELLTTNFNTKNNGEAYHPFGVNFANKFVKKVFGEDKECALSNSAVIREYPVSVKVSEKSYTTKYLDLVFLDLDKDFSKNKDNFVIGIENKFLTEDSENQLNDYYRSLSKIFDADVKIVYLTLDGRKPKYEESLDENLKDNLVCMSWIEEDGILGILMKLIYEEDNFENAINRFKKGNYKKDIKSKKKLITLIKTLIQIKELEKEKCINSSSLEEIKIFVKYLSEIYKKKKPFKVNIVDMKHYYLFEHNSYVLKKLWIPKNIHPHQAAHMIYNFYMKLWNEDSSKNYYEEFNTNKLAEEIKNLEKCFNKLSDSIEEEIKRYFQRNNSIVIEGE